MHQIEDRHQHRKGRSSVPSRIEKKSKSGDQHNGGKRIHPKENRSQELRSTNRRHTHLQEAFY